MKKNDLFVTVAVAFVTAAVSSMLLTSIHDAQADLNPVRPSLRNKGVVLTLETDKKAYKVGDKPIVTLSAANESGDSSQQSVVVTMMSVSNPSPLARMIPFPKEVWKKEITLTPKPGETSKTELSPGIALKMGQSASFIIAVGDQKVSAASVSVSSDKDVKR